MTMHRKTDRSRTINRIARATLVAAALSGSLSWAAPGDSGEPLGAQQNTWRPERPEDLLGYQPPPEDKQAEAEKARAQAEADAKKAQAAQDQAKKAQALEKEKKRRQAAEKRAQEAEAKLQKAQEQADKEAALRQAAEQEARQQAQAEAQAKPGTEFSDCTDGCPKMVVVPAGSFMMGSPAEEKDRWDNEGPQHRVTIDRPFAVGKYPVTVAEWQAFVQATSRSPNSYMGCEKYAPKASNPVVCVTWNDAQAYVKWLSSKTGKAYRLLSEAEWEYAARAGTQTPYPFPSDAIAKYANGYGKADGYEYTSPVGSFPANGYGLYDMIGNAWEWVEDCYESSYEGAPTDGRARTGGSCSSRVLRGGSWNNIPRYLRAANRNSGTPAYRYDVIGLRVARTVP